MLKEVDTDAHYIYRDIIYRDINSPERVITRLGKTAGAIAVCRHQVVRPHHITSCNSPLLRGIPPVTIPIDF